MYMSYVALSFPATVRSTALGTALAVGRIGGAVGPIVGGILLNANASIFVCFMAFAIPCAIVALLISVTRDYTKRNFQDQTSKADSVF